MQIVGIDSCILERPSEVSPFRTLLGVAVTIRDREQFRRRYDEVVDFSLARIGSDKKKRVYKAAHITEQTKH